MSGFGKRESMADFARVLSEMVDVIVMRSKRHATVVEFAEHSSCSVINGLTDLAHPCQVLADLYTLQEHCGKLAGLAAWRGSATETTWPAAWSKAAAIWAFGLSVCTPPGYELDAQFRQAGQARLSEARRDDDARSARGGARRGGRVHRRVGQHGPGERAANNGKRDFADYQVNAKLMAAAPQGRALPALPAGASRRRSHRRSDRRPAERGRRAGRQPDARAEGHSGLAVGGEVVSC